MKHIEKIVLSYPELNQYIGDNAFERSKVLANLKEIKAEYSPSFVKKMGSFLDMPFSKLYDGINLNVAPNVDIERLAKEKCLIFVPNHQSHADYLALNYIIHTRFDGKVPVHIAGGINLNIFPIGVMFRKSGCFFIRRSFQDDNNYKLTLEAYLYYLLKEGHPIEFFFEGGRSRTGKLLPPRFGLFSMLITAHEQLVKEDPNAKPMVFVPVSIMHEFVPEEKSLIKELGGGKKEKESSTQLFKLYKLLSKELGTIHINIGSPIDKTLSSDFKTSIHKMAFKCYRAVGKGICVTPISLLGLILLDEPSGALTFNQILEKVKLVLIYCGHLDVEVSNSLLGDKVEKSIRRGLELLIRDKKIKVIEKDKLHQTFYAVETNRRMELLYFKNSILHHFLVPYFVNVLLISILKEEIDDLRGAKHILKQKINELKYEFYLPDIKEVIQKTLKIVSIALEREVITLEECMHLPAKDFAKISKFIGSFLRGFSYIFEGYYIAALAVKHFQDKPFDLEQISKVSKEIHDLEKEHGSFIKYPESFSLALLKNSLKFFINEGFLRRDEAGQYYQIDKKATELLIENTANDLTTLLTFNMKASY